MSEANYLPQVLVLAVGAAKSSFAANILITNHGDSSVVKYGITLSPA